MQMRQEGFSYVEVLISFFLLMSSLFVLGSMNMTSLHLLGAAKLNQRATLLLLEKIEKLRVVPIEELNEGDYDETSGNFLVSWRIENNTPYFGTKQIRCRVLFRPAGSVLVESIFYRSE
jgi:Tfp pilus assembly protein PilV